MVEKTSTGPIRSISDAEARLLLASAKPTFNSHQRTELRTLADKVSNWDGVIETAKLKFSAPFLYRALVQSRTESVPAEVINRLRCYQKETSFRSLEIAAAQMAFHKTCIAPNNVKHVYLKGIALSLQFGGSFTDRFSRDIDVLIEATEIDQIVRTAFHSGYKVLVTPSPLKYATSENDLKIVTKFLGDVVLISPEGIIIELHRRLDKKNHIFDTQTALETAEPISMSGVEMHTLHKSLHVTYICYHHARHFWSHLHWLADLDLVLHHPEIDRNHLQKSAESVGLMPTVDASIKFRELVSKPGLWTKQDLTVGLEGDFLNACLSNLEGGLELEYELRKGSFTHDLMSKKQISPERVKTASQEYWRSKLLPNRIQYSERPVPSRLFWVYRLQRPFILVNNFFSKLASKRRGKNSLAPDIQTADNARHEDKTD